jgi:hypothetical protein
VNERKDPKRKRQRNKDKDKDGEKITQSTQRKQRKA